MNGLCACDFRWEFRLSHGKEKNAQNDFRQVLTLADAEGGKSKETEKKHWLST